jgi:hypothetical protein
LLLLEPEHRPALIFDGSPLTTPAKDLIKRLQVHMLHRKSEKLYRRSPQTTNIDKIFTIKKNL